MAPSWTWFQLKTTNRTGEKSEKANQKLSLLVRTLEGNPRLAEHVCEVRLNWDLDIDLQRQFIKILTEHSSSLRIVDNVTDPKINTAIEGSKYSANLVSLDLPPPNALPTLEIPQNYIPDLKRFLTSRLSSTIKNLTLFMDPIMLLNNVVKIQDKLEIESIKLHCRADIYPPSLYQRQNREQAELKDIIDTRYLKTLTIISWYDHVCPERVYKFDQWASFKNLEDITLIAVTYNDKKIANLLRSCHKLRRLKLDFTLTLRYMPRDGEVFQAIHSQRKNLEFLDIKVQPTFKVVDLDLRAFKIVIRSPCDCHLCQNVVVNNIFKKKILPSEDDYTIRDRSFETYERVNYYELLAQSNLFPYSKAVDKFPSVKTGPEDIDAFLERFNDSNEGRTGFIPLDSTDFLHLYQCLIHTMRSDLEPILNEFPRLRFLVFNEMSFVVKTKGCSKWAAPLFYSEGFEPNFYVSDADRSLTNTKVYGRELYLN